MPTGTAIERPPRFFRLLARMPIWLYRLHLGWIFDGHMLMITHTGRKTERPRHVVVEVVRHDKASGMYVVLSGWGERSDWYLNIQKTPAVTVHAGFRRFAAVAARLSPEESERELMDYGRRRPIALRALARRAAAQQQTAAGETCRVLAQLFPVIALRPTTR